MWASELQHLGSAVAIPGLQSASSKVVVCRLSCSMECGIFPDQGSGLIPDQETMCPELAGRVFPMSH